MENNQLEVIVQESGLEKSKAEYILENFQHYFSLAAEWEKRAKEIVVTDDAQKDVMQLARVGRLALREKRIVLEKDRKRLKEQSLREGKAIDGIANVLKALIEPIEDYLDKQEHFTEYRVAEEARIRKLEEDKKAEAERIAKEKAAAEEQERIRQENEKLKKEIEAKEKQQAKERAAAEAQKRESEARERAIAEQAAAEKAKHEAALRAAAEAQKKAIEKIKAATITCPHCGKQFVP